MRNLLLSLVLLVAFLLVLALSPAWSQGEYNFGVTDDGLLPPGRRNAYGAGVDSDATGRAFYWAPKNEPHSHPDATLNIKPDAYGLGVGSDQYGRPVERRKW